MLPNTDALVRGDLSLISQYAGVIVPDMMYVGFGIWGAILGGGFYFARRFVRAFERRSINEGALSTLGQRLTAIEESMESLRSDIDRLNAGQEFTTRLLSSRAELNHVIGERSAP